MDVSLQRVNSWKTKSICRCFLGPALLHIERVLLCLKSTKLRSPVLLIRVELRWTCVCRMCVMILTWEKRSTRRQTCPIDTTNLTWTGPESEPGLRGEGPATVHLRHCFMEGLQPSSVCPSVRATCGWRWVRCVGGVTPTGKPKCSGEKPAQCHFVYPKCHMGWPEIEPKPRRWETGDWNGSTVYIFSSTSQRTQSVAIRKTNQWVLL
jgi:hypothetical protein